MQPPALTGTADHPRCQPTVALLEWSHVWEDFLDSVGVSFDAFLDEMTGGWLFGYIDALRVAGVRTVFFPVSARVDRPRRFTHRPTGASVCVLPVPWVYRLARRWVSNPYGDTLDRALGDVRGVRRALLAPIKEVTPYLPTPLGYLAREIRREGCQAILCQEYENPRFDACVLLGGLMRLPVFATFQGGDTQRSLLERPLRVLAIRACAGLIVATRTEAERLRVRYGVPPPRLARIFNPIDLAIWPPADRDRARAALGIPHGARVAVWHGRVELHRKGLDVLLDAWDRVCRQRPRRDLRLLLMGTGTDADELGRRLAAAEVPRVLWVNEYVNDRVAIRRFLAAGDVYVLPSRLEGFPVAPIEAMACGLPVVAADAAGVPDILEGGEASGGLVVPRDDPAALAVALGRLLDDSAWSRQLGGRARRRVEDRFSLETVGKQLRAFMIDGSPPGEEA